MNKTKKIALTASALAAAALLGLTACGSSQPAAEATTAAAAAEATTAAAEQNGYVGSYSLYALGTTEALFGAEEYGQFMSGFASSMSSALGAEEGDSADIAEKADIGKSTLEIKDDGTAVLNVFGNDTVSTWKEENGEFVMIVPPAEGAETTDGEQATETTIKGELKNGVLKLTSEGDGSVMVFAANGADTSEIETKSLQDEINAAQEAMTAQE